MNITPEIKSIVFHQYHGQYVNSDKGRCRLRDADFVDSLEWIELKSLSEISDKDMIWVYDTVHNLHEQRKLYPEDLAKKTPSLKEMKDMISNGFAHYKGGYLSDSAVHQYLISKGYDVPLMLLGWKTLEQSGLAIYEKK